MSTNCPGFSGDFDPTVVFRRLLIPVDFSEESRRALTTACVMKQRFGSEIHVFRLGGTGTNDEFIRGLGAAQWTEQDIRQETKNQLRMFGESICVGIPCIYHETIVGDDVVQGITQAAKESGATLIILPVHPERSLFRTRAEKIMRSVEIPVLFMKQSEVPAETPSPKP